MKSQKNNTTSKLNKNKLVRLLFVFIGSIFVGLAVIGIFLPGLPTTPFLILAAYFYIRSSNKLYNWLINNKILGVYIRGYLSGKGMPLRAKIISLILTVNKYEISIQDLKILYDGIELTGSYKNTTLNIGRPVDLSKKGSVVGYILEEGNCDGEVTVIDSNSEDIETILSC